MASPKVGDSNVRKDALAQVRQYLEEARRTGLSAEEFWRVFDDATRLYDTSGRTSEQYVEAQRAFASASWGLLATMPQSMPFILIALRASSRSARATALGLLALIPQSGIDVVPTVHDLLTSREATREQRGAALGVLERLRDRRSIPIVAKILLDDGADPELSLDAARALLRIVRRRPARDQDPVSAARTVLKSLDVNGGDA